VLVELVGLLVHLRDLIEDLRALTGQIA